MIKLTLSALALALIATMHSPSEVLASDEPARYEGRGRPDGERPHGPPPHFAEMKACMSAKGITLPEPPARGERGEGERPPAPPQFDEATRQALDECRETVRNARSGSSSTSSSGANVTAANVGSVQ